MIEDLRLGDLLDADPAELKACADLESVRVSDLELPDLALTGALVSSSHFTGLSVGDADLTDVRLSEVDLDGVDLTVVRAAGSRWQEVRLSGRLGSLDASASEWRSVHLVGCRLGFVNLRDAELTDVSFTDCLVDELDLAGATARRVAFPGTRVNTLGTRQSHLQDVDLRGATLGSVDGVASLRGATVSRDQVALLAPLMARELGLRIDS